MGKSDEGIRIFLRIRPPATAKQSYLMSSDAQQRAQNSSDVFNYDVDHSFEGSTIHFHLGRRDVEEVVNNTTDDYRFKFRRIFEPRSTQVDVFNSVAKDCVLSVLDGYNSTVFAYGQTGSGKTYSITGGTESYDDRGIIPRALALIYEEVAKRSNQYNWTISISYLQIYNDKGQDLLNHGKDAKTLDDLPAVTVHEGEDEIVLKGLEQHFAPTITDALNLLFLGDTNRLYCETPMNKTSSRSHCVFTVSLEARAIGSSVVRRSKLNLVDLAGSERVSKTGVNGTLLKEAKYINLSLHYLAHVIVALSEQAKGKRDHVPYRNSFMTMVLRDSLGGNCRTSMLATVHAAPSVVQETLSTCQFAQRVALIKQNAQVNEETDPLMLVRKLRTEVAQLKDRLAFYEKGGDGADGGGGADRELTEDEMVLCRGLVDKFMQSADPAARLEGFEGDLARIYYCFTVLKQQAQQQRGGTGSTAASGGGGGGAATRAAVEQAETQLHDYREQVDALQVSLQQKENEMNMLFDMLNKAQGPRYNAETQVDPAETARLEAGEIGGGWSAQMLIQQLRQRAGSAPSTSASVTTGLSPPSSSPTAAPTSTSSLAAAQQLQQHVQKLAEAGALSEAQTTAAQEFIDGKKETARLLESYDLSALTDSTLLQDRAMAFESFKRSYRHYAKVEEMKGTLKAHYETCKETARQLNSSVDAIKQIKVQVQRMRADRAVEGVERADPAEERLLAQLSSEKDAYNALAGTLRSQKEEIDAMHAFMKRSQEQLARDFEEWFGIRQQQLTQATRGQSEAALSSTQPTDNTSETAKSTNIMAAFRGGSASSAPLLPTPPPPLPLPTSTTTTATAAASSLHDPTSSSLHASMPRDGNGSGAGSGFGAIGAATVPSLSARHPASAPSASSLALATPATANTSRLGVVGPSPPRALPAINTLVTSPSPSPATPPPLPPPAGVLGVPSSSSAFGSWGSGLSPRPAHAHHLQPLGSAAQTSAGGGVDGSLSASPATTATTSTTAALTNPYAPQYRSTGNSAADEKLAALYRAREQMRQPFMSP